jgi:ArsR family transcriptional regulator, arsenate/arsenite/antimonite-responsive transcriptional repressor
MSGAADEPTRYDVTAARNCLMRMNEAFKALADPTRRQILQLLRRGEMTAGELAEHFDMTKPSMSHHFAVLKQADLIEARRERQQIYYSLNTTVAEDLLAIVWDLFSNRRPKESKS